MVIRSSLLKQRHDARHADRLPISEETETNKLHDLKADLDHYEVYEAQQVEDFVALYLADVSRDQLDPILDACAGTTLLRVSSAAR